MIHLDLNASYDNFSLYWIEIERSLVEINEIDMTIFWDQLRFIYNTYSFNEFELIIFANSDKIDSLWYRNQVYIVKTIINSHYLYILSTTYSRCTPQSLSTILLELDRKHTFKSYQKLSFSAHRAHRDKSLLSRLIMQDSDSTYIRDREYLKLISTAYYDVNTCTLSHTHERVCIAKTWLNF